MHQQVAVIVVNYGSCDLLDTNLRYIAEHSSDLMIYVVDNYTTWAERDRAAELCDRLGWRLLPQEHNLGFGGGVNAGAVAALADGATDLLLVNPDARIDRDGLLLLREAAGADRNLVAAPVIETAAGRHWFSGVLLDLDNGEMRRSASDARSSEVEWVTGACMWITAEAWAATGTFDETYFLYWEDVDYCYRALQAGITVSVIRDARAVHDEGGTQHEDASTPRAKSEAYYYYNIRNRMLFACRHLDARRIRAWRRSDLGAAYRILLRGGRRQFVQSTAALRAGFRGVRDGRRLYRAALQSIRAR